MPLPTVSDAVENASVVVNESAQSSEQNSSASALNVREGDWVVLECTDGKRVLGHVVPTATARLGKRKRSIGGLIGCKFGDVFAVRDGNELELVEELLEFVDGPGEDAMATERDNRNLHDRGDNQGLSHDAIADLKAEGLAGERLIRAVVENSNTFQQKTPFSQDKYLKRKLQKYNLRLRVVRPTALSLCETYFAKSPEKTLHMRPDALGLLLGYSGVRAGCKAMVYETCTGVVTAAVAERMGGYGYLLNVFVGGSPPGTEVLKMMNLSPPLLASVLQTPLELFSKLNEVESNDSDWIRYNHAEECRAEQDDDPGLKFETSARRLHALSGRLRRAQLKRLVREQCDVLVVATRFDVIPVFNVLLEHVAPSGSFAVYSMYLHALSELQLALQMSKMATRVELIEASLVSHQVLPGRTHPMMSDSATGGYVLWGVRIAVAPPL
jgi:tRNA (adenine58-N1)-methyltransferase non-catalytic subunit